MVRGKEKDGRIHFSYDKCDGAFIHYISVDKKWFNEHNTQNMTAEELDKLAFADKELSQASGRISCWGLG